MRFSTTDPVTDANNRSGNFESIELMQGIAIAKLAYPIHRSISYMSVDMTAKKHRYKQEQGIHWVEVRVKNPFQLFDSRDPAPFRDRDLDEDFVEYIVATMREFSHKTPVKILIHIQGKESKDLPHDEIRAAIQSYWAYQIELFERDLKSFFKRAQLFMVIGILVLILCVTVAQSIAVPTPAGFWGVLREGIVIFGWVSVWKPIELLLFDWYPLFEKVRLYRKLLKTEVDIAVTGCEEK
ncbi:MAG: hypothetical protein WCG04_06040 [Alphaproteobacteria bacterium]